MNKITRILATGERLQEIPTVSQVVDINPALDREAAKALRVGERLIKARRWHEDGRSYTAYDAHDLLAGDHEGGRPGHLHG